MFVFCAGGKTWNSWISMQNWRKKSETASKLMVCVLLLKLGLLSGSGVREGGSLGTSFRLLAVLSSFWSDALAFYLCPANNSASDQNVGKRANIWKLVPREPPLFFCWLDCRSVQWWCGVVPGIPEAPSVAALWIPPIGYMLDTYSYLWLWSDSCWVCVEQVLPRCGAPTSLAPYTCWCMGKWFSCFCLQRQTRCSHYYVWRMLCWFLKGLRRPVHQCL